MGGGKRDRIFRSLSPKALDALNSSIRLSGLADWALVVVSVSPRMLVRPTPY